MPGQGYGEGDGNILKLENQIGVLKYTLIFTNVIEWMLGASIFALALWLKLEPGIQEWLDKLKVTNLYAGIYVLIVAAVIIMVVAFFGCISALNENTLFLLVYIGTQALGFVLGLAGAAVLLDNSARDSRFQPQVRESMRQLIINAHHEESKQTLAMIQENIACCGADGAHDYLNLNQPLPTECRDTVTGNPFYHGCVDELTWFFEEKCGGVAGLAMALCMFHVINIVIALILQQAIKKEQEIDTQ